MANPEEGRCEDTLTWQVNLVLPQSVHLGRMNSGLGLISRCLFMKQKDSKDSWRDLTRRQMHTLPWPHPEHLEKYWTLWNSQRAMGCWGVEEILSLCIGEPGKVQRNARKPICPSSLLLICRSAVEVLKQITPCCGGFCVPRELVLSLGCCHPRGVALPPFKL